MTNVSGRQLQAIYHGVTGVTRVYHGNQIVWGIRRTLPDGYRLIKSITGTTTDAFFLTDIYLGTIKDAAVEAKGTLTLDGGCGLFGARKANNNIQFDCVRGDLDDGNKILFVRSTDDKKGNASLDCFSFIDEDVWPITVHDQLNNNWVVPSDGEIYKLAREDSTGNNIVPVPLMILAVNNNGAVSNNNGTRTIEWLKVWKRGRLSNDLVPALDDNGTPCLYDYISGATYYANSYNGITFEYFMIDGSYTPCSFVAPMITGKQNYIDTGVYLDNECEVYIDFEINNYLDAAQTSSLANRRLYGSRSTATSNNFSTLVSTTNFNVQFDFGDYSKNRYYLTAVEHERYKVTVNSEHTVVNGLTASEQVPVNAFRTPSKCLLFEANGFGQTATTFRPVDAKIYEFRISRRGEPIIDYIPAKRNSDSIVGFYDTVNKQFITGLIPEEYYTE